MQIGQGGGRSPARVRGNAPRRCSLGAAPNINAVADELTPTDPTREEALGRIALWLDPAEVRWIVDQDICGLGATGRHTPECGRIGWKAESALHKAGLKRGDPAAESA